MIAGLIARAYAVAGTVVPDDEDTTLSCCDSPPSGPRRDCGGGGGQAGLEQQGEQTTSEPRAMIEPGNAERSRRPFLVRERTNGRWRAEW